MRSIDCWIHCQRKDHWQVLFTADCPTLIQMSIDGALSQHHCSVAAASLAYPHSYAIAVRSKVQMCCFCLVVFPVGQDIKQESRSGTGVNPGVVFPPTISLLRHCFEFWILMGAASVK